MVAFIVKYRIRDSQFFNNKLFYFYYSAKNILNILALKALCKTGVLSNRKPPVLALKLFYLYIFA